MYLKDRFLFIKRITIIYSILFLSLLLNNTLAVAKTSKDELNKTNINVNKNVTPKTLQKTYNPILLKGLTVNTQNPFIFDFHIDSGAENVSNDAIDEKSKELIEYFLVALTVDEKDLWVNLSPYEKDKIIPDSLSSTELGRNLIQQDIALKKITASLLHPDTELGKSFWEKINKIVLEKYNTTDMPINTFNKVWIMPNNATIYQDKNSIVITNASFKVLLDSDYQSIKNNASNATTQSSNIDDNKFNDISISASEILKQVIIPEIETFVNNSEEFATLKQVYYSLILAKWYKQNIDNELLSKFFINKSKTQMYQTQDKQIKFELYNEYLKDYKAGTYDFVKEEYNPDTQELIHKKYYTGGIPLTDINPITNNENTFTPTGRMASKRIELQAIANSDKDSAMLSKWKQAAVITSLVGVQLISSSTTSSKEATLSFTPNQATYDGVKLYKATSYDNILKPELQPIEVITKDKITDNSFKFIIPDNDTNTYFYGFSLYNGTSESGKAIFELNINATFDAPIDLENEGVQLNAGDTLYNDKAYRIAILPNGAEKILWQKTYNQAKYFSQDDYAKILLNKSGVLTIAWPKNTPIPTQLSDFTNTKAVITADVPGCELLLLQKYFTVADGQQTTFNIPGVRTGATYDVYFNMIFGWSQYPLDVFELPDHTLAQFFISPVAIGDKFHFDRTDTITNINPFFNGKTAFHISQDQKYDSDENFLPFTLLADSFIYLAVDEFAESLPYSLDGFLYTGEKVNTTNKNYKIYQKFFKAGPVVLPAINAAGASNIHFSPMVMFSKTPFSSYLLQEDSAGTIKNTLEIGDATHLDRPSNIIYEIAEPVRSLPWGRTKNDEKSNNTAEYVKVELFEPGYMLFAFSGKATKLPTEFQNYTPTYQMIRSYADDGDWIIYQSPLLQPGSHSFPGPNAAGAQNMYFNYMFSFTKTPLAGLPYNIVSPSIPYKMIGNLTENLKYYTDRQNKTTFVEEADKNKRWISVPNNYKTTPEYTVLYTTQITEPNTTFSVAWPAKHTIAGWMLDVQVNGESVGGMDSTGRFIETDADDGNLEVYEIKIPTTGTLNIYGPGSSTYFMPIFSIEQTKNDNAMISTENKETFNKGGIDLSDINLYQLNEKIRINYDPEILLRLENSNVDNFVPMIINTTVMPSLPFLIGSGETDKKSDTLNLSKTND